MELEISNMGHTLEVSWIKFQKKKVKLRKWEFAHL
jgi:hypothetical protein